MSSKKHKDKECHECKRKRSENQCKGCACDQLKRLQTLTEVDVFLKGTGRDESLEDLVFVTFDRKNCCAFFNDPAEPGSVTVIDCRDIAAIRFEAD